MTVGLGLRKRDWRIISARPSGVETTPGLYYIEGYAAGPVFNMRHEYNGQPYEGPNFAKPNETWEYDLFGDIAYVRVLFTQGVQRHCSYIVCTKEYVTEGRAILSQWVHQTSGAHNVTMSPRCDHASNYRVKGIPSWKP